MDKARTSRDEYGLAGTSKGEDKQRLTRASRAGTSRD